MSGVARVLEIADRVAAGTADDADRDALNALLRSDPACVDAWLRAMRQQRLLHGLLGEHAAAVASQRRRFAPRRVRRRPSHRRPAVVALAAALAAGLLLAVGLAVSTGRSAPALLVVAGGGRVDGVPLAPGGRIAIGATVVAGERLVLRAADGSGLVLADGARLALRADDADAFAADLLAGSIDVDVRPQHGRRFAIATPQAIAAVRGTTFTLAIEGAHTRLAVREGLVRFTRRADGTWTDVGAGGTASTAPPVLPAVEPAAPPIAGADARSWRINLGGPPLEVDGVVWMGQDEALARGMRTEAMQRAEPPSLPLTPEPDAATRALCATALWQKSPRWSLVLPLPDGDYRVRLWVAENDRRYAGLRRMDVLAEGAALFADAASLPYGGWAILGPAPVRVAGGALELDFVARGAIEPHAMALEVLPAP